VLYSSAAVCAIQLDARSPIYIRSLLRLIRELAPESAVLLPLSLPAAQNLYHSKTNEREKEGQQARRPLRCLSPALESAQQLSAALRLELQALSNAALTVRAQEKRMRADSAGNQKKESASTGKINGDKFVRDQIVREQIVHQAHTDRLAARILGGGIWGATEAGVLLALATN
jgi:hypothetical protein